MSFLLYAIVLIPSSTVTSVFKSEHKRYLRHVVLKRYCIINNSYREIFWCEACFFKTNILIIFFLPAVIVKEIQSAPEEKPVSERTPLSRKYIGILEGYKTCNQLDRLVFNLEKKILSCLICGTQRGTERNYFEH